MNLTDRQIQLLKAIIEEYIETAQAVGSETIEKKFPSLGVSPATIRNEMVNLTKTGFLRQPYISAGRVPTPTGLKFYIDQLMKEKSLSTAEEVAVKQRFWETREQLDKLLREATRSLAERTGTMSVATLDTGDIYYSGAANILSMPEFYDIEVTRTVLSLLDEFDRLENIFLGTSEEEDIHITFGQDLGIANLYPCGFVYSCFKTGGGHKGSVGVIGPARLNYPYVIPLVRYVGSVIRQTLGV